MAQVPVDPQKVIQILATKLADALVQNAMLEVALNTETSGDPSSAATVSRLTED